MKYRRSRRTCAALALALSGTPLALSDAARADDILAPIWTGVYVGVQGGANWKDISTDFNSGFSTQGVTGGGHAGVNWQVGGLVIGLEADASLDNAELRYSTMGNTTKLATDWSGTVRGRLGVPVGPALVYATAGYAWSNMSISDQDGTATFKGTHRFDGIVYGVGAEAYVLPNLSVRLEALHFDYVSEQLSIAGAGGAVEEFDPSETVVRAGLTFHLN
jgi:outer membrane immunogenic protein